MVRHSSVKKTRKQGKQAKNEGQRQRAHYKLNIKIWQLKGEKTRLYKYNNTGSTYNNGYKTKKFKIKQEKTKHRS